MGSVEVFALFTKASQQRVRVCYRHGLGTPASCGRHLGMNQAGHATFFIDSRSWRTIAANHIVLGANILLIERRHRQLLVSLLLRHILSCVQFESREMASVGQLVPKNTADGMLTDSKATSME